jgi:hypothetical protein
LHATECDELNEDHDGGVTSSTTDHRHAYPCIVLRLGRAGWIL